MTEEDGAEVGWYETEEEARAAVEVAVEAAVRKDLGIAAEGASASPPSAYLQSEQRVGEGLTRDEIEAL